MSDTGSLVVRRFVGATRSDQEDRDNEAHDVLPPLPSKCHVQVLPRMR
ncbi:MAG: hypothetical protein AAGF73_17720 [Actinomycetota bacterium]